jgi:hypothetical protein
LLLLLLLLIPPPSEEPFIPSPIITLGRDDPMESTATAALTYASVAKACTEGGTEAEEHGASAAASEERTPVEELLVVGLVSLMVAGRWKGDETTA